ncbi:MAG: SOS response-associated peptidase [Woeseia sp.]
MCGRFAFYSPAEAAAQLFGTPASAPVEPRYNIAPTQYVAAIRVTDSDERELLMLRWGLVPSWARDPAIGNRMINARAETVAEKPAFRAAYKSRRCLVLADGFYEWHTAGGVKTPYYISASDGEPFAFAALWERWQNRETDDVLQTATIVTAEANDFMKQLHHRMPVVLKPASAARWLSGDTELLHETNTTTPKMRAWPVSRTVNNARNEGEGLIDAEGAALVEV